MLKKGQMQVEPYEIPFAGALDILCRERIYAFPTLYAATTTDLPEGRDNAGRCLPTAGRPACACLSADRVGRAVFQQPVKADELF